MGAQQSMIEMPPAPAPVSRVPKIIVPRKEPPAPASHRAKPTMPPKDRIAAKVFVPVPKP